MTMDSKTLTLIIIWFVAVVAFFALWAVLLKVIQRIGKRKQKDDLVQDDADYSNNDLASSER